MWFKAGEKCERKNNNICLPSIELCEDSLPKWLSSHLDVSNLRVSSSASKSKGFLVNASVRSVTGTCGCWTGAEGRGTGSGCRLVVTSAGIDGIWFGIPLWSYCTVCCVECLGPRPNFTPLDNTLPPLGTAMYSTCQSSGARFGLETLSPIRQSNYWNKAHANYGGETCHYIDGRDLGFLFIALGKCGLMKCSIPFNKNKDYETGIWFLIWNHAYSSIQSCPTNLYFCS